MAFNRNHNLNRLIQIRILNRHGNRTINLGTRSNNNIAVVINLNRNLVAILILSSDIGVLTRVGDLHTSFLLLIIRLHSLRVISTLNRGLTIRLTSRLTVTVIVLALGVTLNFDIGGQRLIERRVIDSHGNRTINTLTRSNNYIAIVINTGRNGVAVLVLSLHGGLVGLVINLDASRLLVFGRLNSLLAGFIQLHCVIGRIFRGFLRLAVRIVGVSTRIDLVLVVDTITVGISLVRVSRLAVVLRAVELFLVGQSVTVGISVVRVGALLCFFLVR